MTCRHPTTTPLPTDHRGLAAWWGDEALWAIRQAVANPQPSTIRDLDVEHAVRSARCALWHAEKAISREAGQN